ncbi:hypothetical protein [Aquitalea sp. ASV11]|uniref:hypothetical protein n=1 Tax=Aquitalea sp. ASV11 TaxID=2795103 RepID=UPI0018EC7BBA|nr:hypothetical protein [Aquitalea sp. ASV11]
MNPLLTRFLHTIHPAYFMEFPLWNTADGEVVGEFLKVRLASRFAPVSDAAGEPLGVLASLHAVAPGGEPIGGEVLSRLTGVSETPVVLDRFIRCLHLLNYLHGQHQDKILLLPVSVALLERVSQDHGRVFRQIVDQLAMPELQIGFVLPADYAEQPDRLQALQQSYARHGFATYVASADDESILHRLKAA